MAETSMTDPGMENPATSPETQPEVAPEVQAEQPRVKTWFQRLTSVLIVIFCFEIGLFLLVYPWTDGWTDNYFAWVAPGAMQAPWHEFWNNTYVRGAMSGLGVVNVWVALAEVFRMFSGRADIR
jgi:hypothetical protein